MSYLVGSFVDRRRFENYARRRIWVTVQFPNRRAINRSTWNSLLFGQSEGDVRIAILVLLAELVAGGRHDHKLAAIDGIGRWRSATDPWQFAGPHLRARLFVKGTNLRIAGPRTKKIGRAHV